MYVDRVNKGHTGEGPVRLSTFDNWMENQTTVNHQKEQELKQKLLEDSNKNYQTSTRDDPFWKQNGPSLKQFNDLPNKLPDGTWKPNFQAWYMKELKIWNEWKTNGKKPFELNPSTLPPSNILPSRKPPTIYKNTIQPIHEGVFYSFDHNPQINQQWMDYGQTQMKRNPTKINNIQLQNLFNGSQQQFQKDVQNNVPINLQSSFQNNPKPQPQQQAPQPVIQIHSASSSSTS